MLDGRHGEKQHYSAVKIHEHAKKKLEEEYGGEWHIFDRNFKRIL